MKKLYTLAVCVLLLTACQASATSTPTPTPALSPETLSGTQGQGTETDGQPAVKTIYGEISEVIGNALTIKLIEMPSINFTQGEMPGGFTPGEMPSSGSFTLPNGQEITWDEDHPLDMESIRNEMGTAGGGDGAQRFPVGDGADGSTMPSGGTRNFQLPDGVNPEDETAGQGRPAGSRRARAYTGEEIEFMIPVGVPVMTMTRGDNGIEETELAMSKIKAGDIITITYKEDGKTIDKILVTQASAGGGMFMGDGVMISDGVFQFGAPVGGGVGPDSATIYFSTSGN